MGAGAPSVGQSPPPTGDEADRFVRRARVVAMRSVGGQTRARQAILRLGRETRRAIWKTVGGDDPYTHSRGFDSYRHEVAAYELDRVLGLGLVPATTERRVGDRTGSLQLWVEQARSVEPGARELIRGEARSHVAQLRMLRALMGSEPTSEVLVAPDGAVYTIDHAEAFSLEDEPTGRPLERFSKKGLQALEGLTRPVLESAVGRWLTDEEMEALWSRRAGLLEWASSARARRGEAAFIP